MSDGSTPRIVFVMLMVFFAGAVIGCAEGEDPTYATSGPREDTPDEDSADEDTGDFTSDDDDGFEGDCPNAFCVIEQEDRGAVWACENACGCVDDYFDFVDIAAGDAHPISEQELEKVLLDLLNGTTRVDSDRMNETDLTEHILDAFNVRFLLDGINERPLVVRITDEFEIDGYLERDLLLTDPYVGTFEAILLLPRNVEKPVPGVVAVHGHTDDARIYRDDYHGREYPGEGLAIIMPTMRANCADENEDAVTRELLLNGFAFYTVRAYEALLAMRYLQSTAEVDEHRVGYIGHSSGSMVGNLLVRIAPDFRAVVSDNGGDYFKYTAGPLGEMWLQDETAPGAYPVHPSINDLSDTVTPSLAVPYGYGGSMKSIFSFFKAELK
ncbi:MAG: hypothetical protein M5R36_28140 [Deltaproteobacteria bacterium]|nr:hypothetical protein [Deltaproteobacteria bacterium]